MLRPAEVENVSHVELPAHRRAAKLVHKARGFHRAQQEVIPDILERQPHPQFLGQRHHFPDRFLHALIRLGVGNLPGHRARHHQDRGRAIAFGFAHRLLEALDRFRALRRVGMRKIARRPAATDAANGHPGFVARAQDFLLVEVAGRLNPIEPGGLGGLEFLEDCAPRHGGVPDSLFQIAFHKQFRRPISCPGARRGLSSLPGCPRRPAR